MEPFDTDRGTVLMITDRLTQTDDGRPILLGCSVLPPMESPEPTTTHKRPGQDNSKQKQKRNAADRFGVLNGFVDCSLAGLSRSELATWLVLYRDTRHGTAATSQADIARRAGLSIRAVKTAVARLRKRGLLVVVFTGGLNRGPSRYRVGSMAKK